MSGREDSDSDRDRERGRDSDSEYSATELASHWFQTPDRDESAATLIEPPDGVLRFGPGVPARAPAGPPPRPRRRRRGLRRYALAAAVLLAVLGYLAWQRLGPPLAVESVTVESDAGGPGCDGTADVVGVVSTNGSPGTLRYRWVRSDGTESGTLEEKLTRGQREARLHLLWTFRGKGSHEARAELRITAPERHTAATQFSYSCG